jgi:antitoxin CptB
LDDRHKRLLYRATHRGTREADRLVGGFAQAHLETFDPATLEQFESLLNENDVDLVRWISDEKAPPDVPQALLQMMIDFKNSL